MSDFKAKMHRNPKFGWGSAPDPLDGFRGLLLRGGEGRAEEGRVGEGRGREGREVLWSPKKSLK